MTTSGDNRGVISVETAPGRVDLLKLIRRFGFAQMIRQLVVWHEEVRINLQWALPAIEDGSANRGQQQALVADVSRTRHGSQPSLMQPQHFERLAPGPHDLELALEQIIGLCQRGSVPSCGLKNP